MGATDATLEQRDGAYFREILLMSPFPRPIEASDAGSHVKLPPEKNVYLKGVQFQTETLFNLSGQTVHFDPEYQ